MSISNKIPVVILNGFLGSGKTTLFRKLLAQSQKNNIHVCAVVNDMSELDVDGELISNSDSVEENEHILESISSCVLSSKQGIIKLDEAITKFVNNQDPKLIIIETSGSCHPMPLIEYFKEHKTVQLKGVFALVDSLMLSHDYECGKTLIPKMREHLEKGSRGTVNLLVEQIMFCSHLFLTKADRIDADKLSEIAGHVRAVNPNASAHSITYGNLRLESLFELEGYNFHNVAQLLKEIKPMLEAEENADRPYNLSTRVISDDRPFHPQRLWDVCHKYLDQRIYRSKGFFWLASRDKISLLWNQSAGSINLEMIGYWRAGIVENTNHGISEYEIKMLREQLEKETGRFGDRSCDLTVIGDENHVDRFTDALRSCFLTEEEIEDWKDGMEFPDPWPKRLLNIHQ